MDPHRDPRSSSLPDAGERFRVAEKQRSREREACTRGRARVISSSTSCNSTRPCAMRTPSLSPPLLSSLLARHTHSAPHKISLNHLVVAPLARYSRGSLLGENGRAPRLRIRRRFGYLARQESPRERGSFHDREIRGNRSRRRIDPDYDTDGYRNRLEA